VRGEKQQQQEQEEDQEAPGPQATACLCEALRCYRLAAAILEAKDENGAAATRPSWPLRRLLPTRFLWLRS
jgi:hypothetical protein